MRILFLFFIGIITFSGTIQAQQSIADSSIHFASLNLVYRGQVPGGDFADRFGFTSILGFEAGYKFDSNWYVQGGFSFMLNSPSREDSILTSLLTPGGFIINDGGSPTEVRQFQQGFIVPISIGRIFSVIPSHNPNSGFFVEVGAQFIQHKIQFRPLDGPVSFLSERNKKGYDRLTNGFGLRQAFGYKYYSNNGYFNFTLGFDFSENFTQNRRLINIDTGLRDDRQRFDFLGGFTASWTLLIYDKAPAVHYYN